MSKEVKKPGHVTFDEEVIKEHDKLRGTRQKIDEPDTPYHRLSFDDSMSGDDEVGKGNIVGESVEERSESGNISLVTPTTTPMPKDSKVNLGEVTPAKGVLDFGALESRLQEAADNHELPKAAHDKFEDKRKAHYNEFQKLKEWREKQKQLDDEEDE